MRVSIPLKVEEPDNQRPHMKSVPAVPFLLAAQAVGVVRNTRQLVWMVRFVVQG
jgi:hypothetical protein